MATLSLLALLSAAMCLAVARCYVIPEKMPGQLWTPGINKRLVNLTSVELKRLLGSIPMDISKSKTVRKYQQVERVDLPDHFNAAENWPQCSDSICTVRDQGGCGSCYASATAATVSDLTCIKCNGQYSPYLSEQDLLTCCPNCGSCEKGGQVYSSLEYWINEGLVTGGPLNSRQGCQPYTIPKGTPETPEYPTPRCSTSCGSWYNKIYDQDKHKGDTYSIINGAEDMQHAIYTHGPIVAGNLDVYEDFFDYTDGIYHHMYGVHKGLHAVKVFGWGIDNGVPYWLVANSWGNDFGINGFFKIKRGVNECNIEATAFQSSASSTSCFGNARSSSVSNATSNKTKAKLSTARSGHETCLSTRPTTPKPNPNSNNALQLVPPAQLVALLMSFIFFGLIRG